LSSLRAFVAGTSLCPAGLVVEVRATTGEELPAASFGWDVRYAQTDAGRLRSRYVGVHGAGVQICCEEWSLGMLKLGRPPHGCVTFVVPVGPRGSPRIQGRPVPAGAVVVLFDGEELDYRSTGPARLVSVSMERTALDAHVRALLGRHLGELRLQGRLVGLRTDDALLPRLCHELAARAAAHPRRLRDPALARGLERKLVRVLFAGLETPREPDAPCRGRALARRAEAWLRQNLAEPPTIAALCGAVHASPRTLHEAFREHMATTPKAYLKTLRLNAARHDLLRGLPKTRVTDVALDWGFLHFGWFSQDYRRLFGETPSQTLHRGRADAGRRAFVGPGPTTRRRESGPVATAYAM
jgi:AraC family ethanolamine operon transcriptional activator